MTAVDLSIALDPRSVAIVGASENPNKIGGRPLLYLNRFGFRGKIYPINSARPRVQGYATYPDLDALPEVPDLVIVAVPGDAAVETVEACAARREDRGRHDFRVRRNVGARRPRQRAPHGRGSAGRRDAYGRAEFAGASELRYRCGRELLDDVPRRAAGRRPDRRDQSERLDERRAVRPAAAAGSGRTHTHATGNDADVTVAELAAAADDVRRALQRLRMAPLFAGVRGEPALDVDAFCAAAVAVGSLMLEAAPRTLSLDCNPVLLGAAGEGYVVVDALAIVE